MSNKDISPEEFELQRASNYATTFSGIGADFVIQDLMEYCNVNKSSFEKFDSHQTAYNEGKRDVFLYITSLIKMSELDVYNVMKKRKDLNPLEKSEDNKNLDTVSQFSQGLY